MPPFESTESENDYSQNFAADTAAEIGAGLFSGDSPNSGEVDTPDGKSSGQVVQGQNSENPAKSNSVPAEQAPSVNLRPLPKSWKKDMEAHWAKLDPAVHEYVYNREADVMRGLQQYQKGHQSWENLLQPYAPIFQQHQDINPVQLMQGLMNSHLRLLNPQLPTEEKLAFARQIMQEYGIDLAQLSAGSAQTPSQQLDPRITQQLSSLQSEIQTLRAREQAREQAAQESGVSQQLALVEKFAAENPFFNDVGADVVRYIQTGAVQGEDALAKAYELACYANPLVRDKYLAEKAAKAQHSAQAQVQRDGKTGRFVNLQADPDRTSRPKAAGSIEDTINSVVAAHYSKH